MTEEQIKIFASYGVKVVSETIKFDNEDAFKEKNDEMYELLSVYGLPIIENGKIVGKSYPPKKEETKIKNYSLETVEPNLVQEEAFANKKPFAAKKVKIPAVATKIKNTKNKTVNTTTQKKSKAKI